MNLEQFAKKAGVEIIDCSAQWSGGNFGYKSKDYPMTSVCGFKTADAAYKHWLKETFGETTAKAVCKLLADSENK